jgi:D-amino peptidase
MRNRAASRQLAALRRRWARPGARRGQLAAVLALLSAGFLAGAPRAQAQEVGRKLFISVDMEGIGGIGTGAMVSATGKDYALGRRLMTDEVNAVVEAIFRSGPATVVVNDSHGDMQNLLHTELDPRVTYIQGSIKPLGMVEGLDASFDGAIFLGYHARAGTAGGFLAHTGSGIVKGLWLNDMEVGEGELNAALAGAHGVPILLASGDSAFVAQFGQAVPTELVVTKTAITPQSARLRHPQVVRQELAAAVGRALENPRQAPVLRLAGPIQVRLQFSDITRPQVLTAIPGVRQVDGYTVAFGAADMAEAYQLIRLMYRFVSV